MTDIDALTLALQRGDHGVLLVLADALEEAGDPRAEGIRQVVTLGHYRIHGLLPWEPVELGGYGPTIGWAWIRSPPFFGRGELPVSIWDALPRMAEQFQADGEAIFKVYPDYLSALAAAGMASAGR